MEIILLERVAKLGQMGDVVRVRDGYGRNFLLAQGKALRATKENIARFETERAQIEVRNLDSRKEAEAVAGRLEGQTFVVLRSASEAGALYGSVTSRDVAEAATLAGFSVERRQIVIDRPVKELGLHPLVVALHPDVSANITLNVARSAEEAALQASGRTMQDARAAEAAQDQFALSELFDDLGAAALDPIEDRNPHATEQPRL
jgi:large subunit ribosomal protein L9